MAGDEKKNSEHPARDRQVARLRAAINHHTGIPTPAAVCSTGFPALDHLLPQQGLLPGWLVEWLTEPGDGGSLLALWVAQQCLASTLFPQKVLAILDPEGTFYPPTLLSWGIRPEQTLILRPQGQSETLWAWEEVLRSPFFPVAWGAVPHLSTRWHRRLQLACETGSGLGIFLRPHRIAAVPNWSAVQWRVKPQPSHPDDPLMLRRWRVSLLKCPGQSFCAPTFPSAEIYLRGTLEESLHAKS